MGCHRFEAIGINRIKFCSCLMDCGKVMERKRWQLAFSLRSCSRYVIGDGSLLRSLLTLGYEATDLILQNAWDIAHSSSTESDHMHTALWL